MRFVLYSSWLHSVCYYMLSLAVMYIFGGVFCFHVIRWTVCAGYEYYNKALQYKESYVPDNERNILQYIFTRLTVDRIWIGLIVTTGDSSNSTVM
jgi:hypothetical protein